METYLTFNKYEKYNLTIFTILIFVFIFMYVSFHCFYKSPLVWKTFLESTNHRRQDIAVLILNVKCCNLISRSENCLSLQNRQLIWYLIKSHFYSSCKMYKLSVWEAYRMDIFKCWWEVSMLSEYFRYLRLWFSGARRVRAQWGLSPYFFLQLFCYSQPVAEQQSNSPEN